MSSLHAPVYRWTVEEYEALGRAGFFQENDQVELLNGEIVVRSPIGYRHAQTVNRLTEFFVLHARKRYVVAPGNPIYLDPHSEPQPDLCLLHPLAHSQQRHPSPDQIFLAIEVADSSLRYDREDKGAAYARQRIPEYWLLNLKANLIEVYRDPVGGTYCDKREVAPEAKISPLAFPDIHLRAGEFLPG